MSDTSAPPVVMKISALAWRMLMKNAAPIAARPHQLPRSCQPFCRHTRRVKMMLAGGMSMPIERSGSVVQQRHSRASSRSMPRQPAADRTAMPHQSAIERETCLPEIAVGSDETGLDGAGSDETGPDEAASSGA